MKIVYFRHSAKRNAASADRTVRLAGISVAVAARASISGLAGSPWTASDALIVAGEAIVAYAAPGELTTPYRRNAERYRRALDALEEVAGHLDDVRAAAVAGNLAAVKEFAAAVKEQISLEHRQSLEGGQGAKAALARLADALAENNKR